MTKSRVAVQVNLDRFFDLVGQKNEVILLGRQIHVNLQGVKGDAGGAGLAGQGLHCSSQDAKKVGLVTATGDLLNLADDVLDNDHLVQFF
jgi:hypothetical protein